MLDPSREVRDPKDGVAHNGTESQPAVTAGGTRSTQKSERRCSLSPARTVESQPHPRLDDDRTGIHKYQLWRGCRASGSIRTVPRKTYQSKPATRVIPAKPEIQPPAHDYQKQLLGKILGDLGSIIRRSENELIHYYQGSCIADFLADNID